MSLLEGDQVFLRALEPEDVALLYIVENNPDYWHLSDTQIPFSRYSLSVYQENAFKDIYEVKQLRLVICLKDSSVVGFVDLYDFNPKHKRAGVGIIITNNSDRSKGIGKETVRLMVQYAFKELQLHQIYASVLEDNIASKKLFTALGFRKSGERKDWVFHNGNYKNEYFYQIINTCTLEEY